MGCGDVAGRELLERMLIREPQVITSKWLAHTLGITMEDARVQMQQFWTESKHSINALMLALRGSFSTGFTCELFSSRETDIVGNGVIYALYPEGIRCSLSIVNSINTSIAPLDPIIILENHHRVPDCSSNVVSHAKSVVPEKRSFVLSDQSKIDTLSLADGVKSLDPCPDSKIKDIDDGVQKAVKSAPRQTHTQSSSGAGNAKKPPTKQGSILSFFKPKAS